MRIAWVIVIGAVVSTAPLAYAQVPASIELWGGLGAGSGHRDGIGTGGPAGIAGAEAAWRVRPGLSLIGLWEGGIGAAPIGVKYPEGLSQPHIESLGYSAALLGLELSSPRNSGIAHYVRAAMGAGRLLTDGLTVAAATGRRRSTLGENAFVFSAAAGVRAVPRPGPVGLVFGVRTSHAIGHFSAMHVTGATLGLTVYPLGARTHS